MSELTTMGARARDAARQLRVASDQEKSAALRAIAGALIDHTDEILAENEKDLAAARENGMSKSMMDRLALSRERIRGMADGVLAVANWPDPVGHLQEERTLPNGILVQKVSVPLGVVGIIFESRPNVTSDCAALCIRAGNTVILRGGKEAFHSNCMITDVMRQALGDTAIPQDAVQLVTDTDRRSATEMMGLTGYIDVLIPRGGAGLIRSVVDNAKVPVIETGAGNCHIYVDQFANIDMAADIVLNAKTSRPSVCNAAEHLLVHRAIAGRALPVIAARLRAKDVELHVDEAAGEIIGAADAAGSSCSGGAADAAGNSCSGGAADAAGSSCSGGAADAAGGPAVLPATEEDWGTEYIALTMGIKIVDSVDEAIDHIERWSTHHSDCIVTDDPDTAERFLAGVDSAAVYHNASTRFTDGGEMGLGAEIGISTQKLHARGPMGVNQLVTYKYLLSGNGQLR